MGNRLRGSCYEGSGCPTTSWQASAWEKDAAWPRVNNVSGEAARREAASLLSTADRRMSKWRPGCVSAMPQSMRSLSKRQTHFDRLVEDGAQGALRPSCPADEAINPNRQTGSQRMKRSTPIAGRVSSGRRTNVKLQPPDLDRGRRATSNPPVRSALPAKDQRQLRFSSSTLVGDRGRANHPPVVPVQQGSRTQVSMVGNLGKSLTVQSLSTSRDRQKRACEAPLQDCRQIVHKTSLATLRTRRPATATTVRRSGAAEAPAFSALSACRRAPSAAS